MSFPFDSFVCRPHVDANPDFMGLVRLPFQSIPVSHLCVLTLLYLSLGER